MKKALVLLGIAVCAAAQSVTTTPNIGLQVPSYQQSNWQVPIDYDLVRLDLFLSGNASLPALTVTGNLTVGGVLSGTLPANNPNAGTFGDALHCPSFTVNSQGLITAASQSTSCPGGSGGGGGGGGSGITALTGDVSASGTGSVAATLATVNSAAGTYGDASHCPTFTVNAKGLITSISQSTSCPGAGGSGVIAGTVFSEAPAGMVNGTNATFTLSHAPSPALSVQLTRNGLTQAPGTDFSLSGTTVTFASGSIPQTGDSVWAWYTYGTGGAGTGNVTAATTLASGDVLVGAGSSVLSDSGVLFSSVVTLTGTQTLTNKSITGQQINSGTVPIAQLPVATSASMGIGRPDNSTIGVSGGVWSVIGGSAGLPNVLNLIAGNNTGGGADSGIAPSAVCLANGTHCPTSGGAIPGTLYTSSSQTWNQAITAAGTSILTNIVAPPNYNLTGDPIPSFNLDPNQPQACNFSSNILLTSSAGGKINVGCNYAGTAYSLQRTMAGNTFMFWQPAPFNQILTLLSDQMDVYDGGQNEQSTASGFYVDKPTWGAYFPHINVWTNGQVEGMGATTTHRGLGDTLGEPNYVLCWEGGMVTLGDEGCEAHDHQVLQGIGNNLWTQISGTIAGSPSAGATSLTVNIASGDGSQAPGGYFVDTTQVTNAGVVTNIAFSGGLHTATFSGVTLPVSTAKGTLTAAVGTPGVNTFSLSFLSGSISAISVGSKVCVSDQGITETLTVTSVGTNSFVATSLYTHYNGATFGVGGLCGSFFNPLADDVTSANWTAQRVQQISGTYKVAFPIVTSDATHANFAVNAAGYYQKFTSRFTSGTTTGSNPNGTNCTWGPSSLPLNYSNAIYICVLTTPGTYGTNDGTYQLSTAANGYNIYPGAKIASVQSGGGLSHTLTLEPNSTAWANGDNWMEIPNPAVHFIPGNDVVESFGASLGGTLQGGGDTFNQLLHDLDAVHQFTAGGPVEMYSMHGGPYNEPRGLVMNGELNSLISGGPSKLGAVVVNCDSSIIGQLGGCTPTSWLPLDTVNISGNYYTLGWDVSQTCFYVGGYGAGRNCINAGAGATRYVTSGTSDTIFPSDTNGLVVYDAAAFAVTLAQANLGGNWTPGQRFTISNYGTGAVTVTTSTSYIGHNGGSSQRIIAAASGSGSSQTVHSCTFVSSSANTYTSGSTITNWDLKDCN